MNVSQIFPPGLVEETLQTLALLLPFHDKGVKKWYGKQVTRFKLDGNAIKGGATENRRAPTGKIRVLARPP
jgi:hypothetical protein